MLDSGTPRAGNSWRAFHGLKQPAPQGIAQSSIPDPLLLALMPLATHLVATRHVNARRLRDGLDLSFRSADTAG